MLNFRSAFSVERSMLDVHFPVLRPPSSVCRGVVADEAGCPNFSCRQGVIMQNEPNFRAWPPAKRRPRTYFHSRASFHSTTFANPVTFNPEQAFGLRSWCGAQPMIMQNKANFGKANFTLTQCSGRTYAKNALSADPKNKAN